MHIHIGAIGRLKHAPERQLCEKYIAQTKKLGRTCGITGVSIHEFGESRAATAALRKQQEARDLLSVCPQGAHIFALDERGKNMTSRQFANSLAALRDNGTGKAVFLIGGPDGLGNDIFDRHVQKLSFGAMTWPHRLVRVMLSEQIYRTVTILMNHPYHRD